jgi:D-amino peptidase
MRVYLTADMEGINGVVTNEHTDTNGKDYGLAREWMLKEVNAAIQGTVKAGAREVVVNDSHNTMTNLILSQLHPAASLISGTNKPFSMVEGLDSSFGAIFLIGYHAKIGTHPAVQDHTYAYSIFHDVLINDISVGEFGMNAGMAGYFGVPIALITGDKAVVNEAKALVPDIESVVVKEATGRYSARCYPFEQTLEEISRMAHRATELAPKKKVFKFSSPLTLQVVFQKTEFADKAQRLNVVERVDGFSVTYDAPDYQELYRTFLAMLHLCM